MQQRNTKGEMMYYIIYPYRDKTCAEPHETLPKRLPWPCLVLSGPSIAVKNYGLIWDLVDHTENENENED